jgi:hypothetical protein
MMNKALLSPQFLCSVWRGLHPDLSNSKRTFNARLCLNNEDASDNEKGTFRNRGLQSKKLNGSIFLSVAVPIYGGYAGLDRLLGKINLIPS